tara:strand:+ start:137 stop:595 length:459 start_codon:yes stop_codon:yes gene_type:complete
MKTVIFDLDGTLANIDARRDLSTNVNGKIDWDTFFAPDNIQLDLPNRPVVAMAQMMKDAGHRVVIFSGRSKETKEVTRLWLKQFNIPFDVLKMRPMSTEFKFMPDNLLKKKWVDDLFPNTDDILCVFDDRDKVVKMWRDSGITCFQVAEGNF